MRDQEQHIEPVVIDTCISTGQDQEQFNNASSGSAVTTVGFYVAEIYNMPENDRIGDGQDNGDGHRMDKAKKA